MDNLYGLLQQGVKQLDAGSGVLTPVRPRYGRYAPPQRSEIPVDSIGRTAQPGHLARGSGSKADLLRSVSDLMSHIRTNVCRAHASNGQAALESVHG